MFVCPHLATVIQSGAFAAQGVVDMKKGTTAALVANLSDYTLHLPVGMLIAVYKLIYMPDFMTLTLPEAGPHVTNCGTDTSEDHMEDSPLDALTLLPPSQSEMWVLIGWKSATEAFKLTNPILELDFSKADSLSIQEHNYLMCISHEQYHKLFSEGSKPGIVPGIQHHIETGDHMPLALPPF